MRRMGVCLGVVDTYISCLFSVRNIKCSETDRELNSLNKFNRGQQIKHSKDNNWKILTGFKI